MTKIPEEKVKLYKGYYQCFYVMIQFNNLVGVASKG